MKHAWIGRKFGPVEIIGELASKSNSRKIVRFGSRVASIKSQAARDYVKSFILQAGHYDKAFEGPVKLVAVCWYKDMRRDLDIALLQDCIQAAGIIKNDRQVWEIQARRRLDKKEPRVLFYLEALDEEALK